MGYRPWWIFIPYLWPISSLSSRLERHLHFASKNCARLFGCDTVSVVRCRYICCLAAQCVDLWIRLLNNKFHGLSPSGGHQSLFFDKGFPNNMQLQHHLADLNTIWWYFESMRFTWLCCLSYELNYKEICVSSILFILFYLSIVLYFRYPVYYRL